LLIQIWSEVLPAHAEIERQIRPDFPVVLNVGGEIFARHVVGTGRALLRVSGRNAEKEIRYIVTRLRRDSDCGSGRRIDMRRRGAAEIEIGLIGPVRERMQDLLPAATAV